MYDYEKRKLNIQLVPQKCWFHNLRSLIPNWQAVSKFIRSKGKCDICGKQTDDLDAHEVWKYDDKQCIQSLKDIICVCKDCHACIHMGFTQIQGEDAFSKAITHYINVNNLTKSQFETDWKEAGAVWLMRSCMTWTADKKQLLGKVKELTGISCDFEEPINGRYYEYVRYEDKDIAKQYKARWDNDEKMWYFMSIDDRNAWRSREKDTTNAEIQ